MRTIDICKKGINLTALVITVECVRQTGSLIIPQKPDKLSPGWKASIDFCPEDETHVLSVIHGVDDSRDKADASNWRTATIEARCIKCHMSRYTTGEGEPVLWLLYSTGELISSVMADV